MLGDRGGSSEKEKHWQKQKSSKLEANFFQQDETHFRYTGFEMINLKMPNWRCQTSTQENWGLDKYLWVISIRITGGMEKGGKRGSECVRLSLAKATEAKGQRGGAMNI